MESIGRRKRRSRHFRTRSARDFDLVVGADGLHSRVRELVFGAENQFEKYLGYKVAAFEAEGYRPRDELVYVMYTEVGRQVGRFAMRDDRTMFLFIFAGMTRLRETEEPSRPKSAVTKALRKQRVGMSADSGRTRRHHDLYFDRVSQIRMNPQQGLWTRGRVTLIGDAACCVSLLAGQGSALAMVAAYILAGELHLANGDYAQLLGGIRICSGHSFSAKQKAALRFAGAFAPKSKFGLFLRNRIFNLMAIPWIADFAVGRDLADNIELPNYK